ncbi:Hypothetical predicted protein [Olea europaea subsp. europaea]|uniref:Uncharacterized protein n=1 Tax=Olea europaea subsp. europaea TaxID=158383 RepID=A0A8S0PKG9_OLEEU|nr:Hypothetical predicted protein [Olea europaea subsp. europaea]
MVTVRHPEMMTAMGSQEVITMATIVRIAMVTTVRILVSLPPLRRHRFLHEWRGEVEELLLDQRILFEMRLRSVKLEIEQHVTFECTRLREFIASLVAPPPPTTSSCLTGAIVEPDASGCSPQDGAYGPPCTDEGELLVGTEDLPEGADIVPCPDVEHEPALTSGCGQRFRVRQLQRHRWRRCCR